MYKRKAVLILSDPKFIRRGPHLSQPPGVEIGHRPQLAQSEVVGSASVQPIRLPTISTQRSAPPSNQGCFEILRRSTKF